MQAILSNLKTLVVQALVSAKTWTLLIGLTATYAAKHNIVLPPDLATEIAAGFATLLAGQIVTAHVLTTTAAKSQAAMQLAKVHADGAARLNQAGVVRRHVMVALALVGLGGAVYLNGCGGAGQSIVQTGDNIINCEKDIVAPPGTTILQALVTVAASLTLAVATAVATGGDVVAALEAAAIPLGQKWGTAAVACVMNNLDEAIAGVGSGSGSAAKAMLPPNKVVVRNHGWRFAQ